MALLKLKDIKTGFTIEYWEIIGITIDFVKGYTRAILAGYKDASIYEKDKTAFVEQYPFEFAVTIKDLEQTPLMDIVYARVTESRMTEVTIEDGEPDEHDDKGDLIKIGKKAVTELRESNFFSDATRV